MLCTELNASDMIDTNLTIEAFQGSLPIAAIAQEPTVDQLGR